ncbi:hypothetical protein [Hymenobacter cellulosilyticus]|uniref:Uncharacterized protein n=1 Tax=Hymenobacter cellulosilyticus TaxID=2932248 RepID=A0A8T9PYV5_9BACT|nr:hypothetical protein [Hymenobacter cellulosilyticus]UOQ70616.1 hypothetical protein MUN79_18120 [Hymenobacter cellulosilyticus]
MSRILLLGAGRSASSLLHYLLHHAAPEGWQLTVADVNPDHLSATLAAHAAYARPWPSIFSKRLSCTSWSGRPIL